MSYTIHKYWEPRWNEHQWCDTTPTPCHIIHTVKVLEKCILVHDLIEESQEIQCVFPTWIFILLTWGVWNNVPINPGVAQTLGKEFSISVPPIIQEKKSPSPMTPRDYLHQWDLNIELRGSILPRTKSLPIESSPKGSLYEY